MKKLKLIFLIVFFCSCNNHDSNSYKVIITSPDNNSTVSVLVTIKCLVDDDIEKIELFIDGVSTEIIVNSKPYSLIWNTSNYEDSDYSIFIRSYDSNGNIFDSEPITLNVFKTIKLWGIYYSIENTTKLDLNNSLISGSISPEISDLINLNYLDLSFNQLSGEIPIEIFNLSSLSKLNLSGNQLTGSIPLMISSFVNLTDLNLSINQFSGVIPESVINLENLTYLNLSINQFEGSIPSNIGDMINLNYLYLHSNKLSNSIPGGLGNITDLIELTLYRNNLSGEIPESICNLVGNNTLLSIYDNEFCPPYPICIENIVGEQYFENCD